MSSPDNLQSENIPSAFVISKKSFNITIGNNTRILPEAVLVHIIYDTSFTPPENLDIDIFHLQSDSNNLVISQLSYFDNDPQLEYSYYYFGNDPRSENNNPANSQLSYFGNDVENL